MTMSSKSPHPAAVERLLAATLAALVYGLLLYIVIWASDYWDALPFFAGLIFMPMAIASVGSCILDPRAKSKLWHHVRVIWMIIAILIVLTIIFFNEAGMCVVMAAPFFMGFSALGSALTLVTIRFFRSRRSSTLVIALPLIVLPMEPHISYEPHEGSVTTTIDIAAPPDLVWNQTIEIPNVRPEELSWTFSHNLLGLPQPVDARLDSRGVDGVRQLQWTRGIRFQEIITHWDENRSLAWKFHFAPDAIPAAVEAHIKVDSAYLKLTGGAYDLQPLPGGRTRLTLTTRYRIATPINIYCDFWGKVFLNDFHSVVLKVIRDRSEKIAGAA
ncbi:MULTISPECIES: hypothetical protein [unclassified Rhizobium]|mgnify:FL=1|jgi:hypothetical protein|uniref:hypothetical protein n=1 Tax=unclassified Rhizobium TaxID=2613769 RepID=UPI0006469BC5|nr:MULTISPECIES: hypothetical protein [unclassified Rhizobium]OJY78590.1 MAG: hypothetical protein BGP09_02210 [Rhizobium sp. 60-20]RKD51977.1 hypothetical protein BJ928_1178 [Rhizobium sp. WW_1]